MQRHPLHPLRVERAPLLDPEAMLLVDDAEPEAGELDIRLDQRVGADHQAELASSEAVESFFAPGRRGGSGEQRKRRGLFRQQLSQA